MAGDRLRGARAPIQGQPKPSLAANSQSSRGIHARLKEAQATPHGVTEPLCFSSLPSLPDRAILRLIRALARQAAREDHEREKVERDETGGDLLAVLDRPAEREIRGRPNSAMLRVRAAQRPRRRGDVRG
jgi:hypothetical protein